MKERRIVVDGVRVRTWVERHDGFYELLATWRDRVARRNRSYCQLYEVKSDYEVVLEDLRAFLRDCLLHDRPLVVDAAAKKKHEKWYAAWKKRNQKVEACEKREREEYRECLGRMPELTREGFAALFQKCADDIAHQFRGPSGLYAQCRRAIESWVVVVRERESRKQCPVLQNVPRIGAENGMTPVWRKLEAYFRHAAWTMQSIHEEIRRDAAFAKRKKGK